MKVNEIFSDRKTKVFVIIDSEADNELEMTIEPTGYELIPEEEGIYFVKAKQVFTDCTVDCFINVIVPERISEIVIHLDLNGNVTAESVYDQDNTVIPAIASDCFGDYNLFYAKENPQVCIDILNSGLARANNKSAVAEDLGYILRDEGRFEESIEAFKISEQMEPSSNYVFYELAALYKSLEQFDKQKKYEEKFKSNI